MSGKTFAEVYRVNGDVEIDCWGEAANAEDYRYTDSVGVYFYIRQGRLTVLDTRAPGGLVQTEFEETFASDAQAFEKTLAMMRQLFINDVRSLPYPHHTEWYP